MNWLTMYENVDTTDPREENRLIVNAPVEIVPRHSHTNTIWRASSLVLRQVLGANTVSVVLDALAEMDAVLWSEAELRPSSMMVHHNMYGLDEYAHSPNAWGNFISFNLAATRVRALFESSLAGCPTAQAALVDLYVHEKAHLRAFTVGEKETGHDARFYAHKLVIRMRVLNRRYDPFVGLVRGRLPDHTKFANAVESAGVLAAGANRMGLGAMI